jgi:hypothetical protein
VELPSSTSNKLIISNLEALKELIDKLNCENFNLYEVNKIFIKAVSERFSDIFEVFND